MGRTKPPCLVTPGDHLRLDNIEMVGKLVNMQSREPNWCSSCGLRDPCSAGVRRPPKHQVKGPSKRGRLAWMSDLDDLVPHHTVSTK